MSYIKSIQTAVDFIEAHLDTSIKTSDVARESAYSLFHFHRIFQAATGDTLKSYINHRRLTQAARRLLEKSTPLIQISLDYGFESQESFTRAFKRRFGVTPGRYRKEGIHYPTVYRNKFDINQLLFQEKGDLMEPEIKTKDTFKVIGLRYFGNNENNEIPQLWQEFMLRWDEVPNLANPRHSYGVCTVPENSGETQEAGMAFEYVAGREVQTFEKIPDGMVAREVPGGKFAVFTHYGPLNNLKQTIEYIYGEWTRKGEYTIRGNVDFEFYNEKFDPAGSPASELFLYIPIE
ncbi:MAG: AraC family transcriptional regulator [Desulfobacteraceae bacterium]|nr:MAG: AraC family transcriptional regulator [Desulfobacteraceae bacterium]